DPFHDGSMQIAALNNLSALLLRRYLGFDQPDTVRLVGSEDSETRLSVDEDLRMEIKLLKSLMWRYVYAHPSLQTHQFGQRQIIRKLFDFLHEAIQKQERGLIP